MGPAGEVQAAATCFSPWLGQRRRRTCTGVQRSDDNVQAGPADGTRRRAATMIIRENGACRGEAANGPALTVETAARGRMVLLSGTEQRARRELSSAEGSAHTSPREKENGKQKCCSACVRAASADLGRTFGQTAKRHERLVIESVRSFVRSVPCSHRALQSATDSPPLTPLHRPSTPLRPSSPSGGRKPKAACCPHSSRMGRGSRQPANPGARRYPTGVSRGT